MKVRSITAAALAAAIALTVSACGTSSPNAGAGGAITVWTNTQPSFAQNVVEKLVTKFNKQYPGGGHIAITWIGGEAYKQKLAVSMAGHQPPGIFYTYGGQLLDQYVKGGDVANVTSALNGDPSWIGRASCRERVSCCV